MTKSTIRASQMVTQFGPGSMLDLPEHGVMISGLDDWGNPKALAPVYEPRLAAKVSERFEGAKVKLLLPPAESDDPAKPSPAVTAWVFPEWFVTSGWQHPGMAERGVRSRPLVHRAALAKGKWESPDKKQHKVVPIRFVQACVKGHISDIAWRRFVHRGRVCERPLWLDEVGTSGDLADVIARCECGLRRDLVEATQYENDRRPLGDCEGWQRWLGPKDKEPCEDREGKRLPNRLLVRSASNAYFSQTLSVISIPEQEGDVEGAVARLWDAYLEKLPSLAMLQQMASFIPPLQEALSGLDLAAVWAEVERRRSGAEPAKRSIKRAELDTLLASADELGSDTPEGDFYARRLKLPAGARGPASALDRVVLVHRLREVTALVGFTRFEAMAPDIDGELALDLQSASLARETTWVPAVENRGEGVFLSFDPRAIERWRARAGVSARERALTDGFEAWQATHPGSEGQRFPGVTYVLLHSLSHLLITAMALECGYSSTAIRERVYVSEGACGILLYTGSFDAEGTLGGLVEAARRIEHHLRNALELGRLCSNDPVCAQHRADHPEGRFLHGAACHGCLLIGETCCERRNEFLDRALVVPTVEDGAAAFFSGPLG